VLREYWWSAGDSGGGPARVLLCRAVGHGDRRGCGVGRSVDDRRVALVPARWRCDARPFPANKIIVGERRLTLREREEIACRRAAGEGVRTIARELGRSPSTVSRELRRGTVRRKSGYRATVAQALADQRARRPKARRLALHDRLRAHVQNRLHTKASPEQVSRRLVLLFPGDAGMRVSHETSHDTMYRSLYVQGRGGPATRAGQMPAHRPGAAQDPANHGTARTPRRHGQHRTTTTGSPRPGGARPLGGRPHHRRREQIRGRNTRGALHRYTSCFCTCQITMAPTMSGTRWSRR
jgi:hypothetical protein